MSFCEPLMRLRSMLGSPALQIIRYPDVKGAIVLAGHYIDIEIPVRFHSETPVPVLDCLSRQRRWLRPCWPVIARNAATKRSKVIGLLHPAERGSQ